MAGKKVGSDGQIRKTTAEWAADTATYPEGMRLMDVTTGTVRVSKGTTYALAWTSGTPGSYSPPIPQSDVSGLATAFENVYSAIAQEASSRANADGALDIELAGKADAVQTYIANISQTGTSAPTVDSVILNTAGISPSFGYAAVGLYTVTSAGSFPAGKVLAQLLNGNDGDTSSLTTVTQAIRVDADTINLLAVTLVDGMSVDSSLNGSQLVIHIYP